MSSSNNNMSNNSSSSMTATPISTTTSMTAGVERNQQLQQQHSQQQGQQQTVLNSIFNYTSNVTSNNIHNPLLILGSILIRISFGSIVQLVSDCLQCRGSLSFKQLNYYLIQNDKRKLMTPSKSLQALINDDQIRSSLLVLIQHNIVTYKQRITNNPGSGKTTGSSSSTTASTSTTTSTTYYTYKVENAIHILRYAKYIEYIKKALDVTAACLVETLLLNGRLRTIDLIVKTTSIVGGSSQIKSEKLTSRQIIIDTFCKLVNTGFIEQLTPPTSRNNNNPGIGETEMNININEPVKKKVKINIPGGNYETTTTTNEQQQQQQDYDQVEDVYKDEDPAVVILLKSTHSYKVTLPVDAVWIINKQMFHETYRAFAIGKLVSERYGNHIIQSAGSLVTAALRYRSHMKHGAKTKKDTAAAAASGGSGTGSTAGSGGGGLDGYTADNTIFTIDDIIKYIPKPVVHILEKKIGGLKHNLSISFQQLCEKATNPEIVRRIGENRYEITINTISKYIHDKIIQQIIFDRHGQIATRCINILLSKGYLESDTLAECAMAPIKDIREVLHVLYRNQYIDLLHLSNNRIYNPSKTIFIWCCHNDRLYKKIISNVLYAIVQLKLRYEHECSIVTNKQWLTRTRTNSCIFTDNSTTSTTTTTLDDTTTMLEENDSVTDKINYQRFSLGLERLDVAIQQLDETLMALQDF